jgi:hypothetical protein
MVQWNNSEEKQDAIKILQVAIDSEIITTPKHNKHYNII